MKRILNEIGYDAKFIQGHTLQPHWYKILKVFLLTGLIVGYYLIFGEIKTVVFFGCFFWFKPGSPYGLPDENE